MESLFIKEEVSYDMFNLFDSSKGFSEEQILFYQYISIVGFNEKVLYLN